MSQDQEKEKKEEARIELEGRYEREETLKDRDREKWEREREEVLDLLDTLSKHPKIAPRDRLRAIELIAKIKGFFSPRKKVREERKITLELPSELVREIERKGKEKSLLIEFEEPGRGRVQATRATPQR